MAYPLERFWRKTVSFMTLTDVMSFTGVKVLTAALHFAERKVGRLYAKPLPTMADADDEVCGLGNTFFMPYLPHAKKPLAWDTSNCRFSVRWDGDQWVVQKNDGRKLDDENEKLKGASSIDILSSFSYCLCGCQWTELGWVVVTRSGKKSLKSIFFTTFEIIIGTVKEYMHCSLIWYLNQACILQNKKNTLTVAVGESSEGHSGFFFACSSSGPQRLKTHFLGAGHNYCPCGLTLSRACMYII